MNTPSVSAQLQALTAAEPALATTLPRATSIDDALQQLADASARTGLPIDLQAAHAVMDQALGAAAPLSDEALADVAGGTVKPGAIVWSILTLGFSCALVSYHASNLGYTCEDAFHGRIPRTHPPGD